jgi:hypothetical protein
VLVLLGGATFVLLECGVPEHLRVVQSKLRRCGPLPNVAELGVELQITNTPPPERHLGPFLRASEDLEQVEREPVLLECGDA